eukprot:TRINITY_DN2055_c0_g1_i1.p1 TRINITY_DN2055_c0_g1~~TRINITY_DN2055_c0_g1_i1.p1  ORF type:complete len:313 (+),score=78.38 TRINITY_DN2055_c0_g1_i1:100-939(+)
MGFQSVEQASIGYTYNGISGNADFKNSLPEGRHFVGPFNSLITFPLSNIHLNFEGTSSGTSGAIAARSTEGLSVSLDIDVYYKLDEDEFEDVFNKFGTRYNQFYLRLSRDIIRDVTSRFEAFSLFSNRTGVELEMFTELNQKFKSLHAEIYQVDLNQISLPSDYEASITEVEKVRQTITQAEATKQSMIIEAETHVIEATTSATIKINAAEGEATSIINAAEAEATEISLLTNATQDALKKFQTEFSMSTKQILRYFSTMMLEEHDDSKVIFDAANFNL